MSEKKFSPLRLVFCAVAIAIAFVLSNVKLPLPLWLFGGSVTLCSMLFITLVGIWYGPVYGIITGIAYGFLQLIIDPYVVHPIQLLFDYPLAFGALGLSGFLKNAKFKVNIGKVFSFNNLHIGFLLGVFGRVVFSTASGYIFFASYAPESMHPLIYSIAYNGSYMLIEAIITLIILSIAPVNKAIKYVSSIA